MKGTCSIQDRCGPSGKECASDDRVCQDEAVRDGLEILCESTDTTPSHYVYCPRGTEARDSSVVWLLLVVAVLIATVGGGVFYVVLKRAPSRR